MKHFNKFMAAAIIAGAMSLTSCVDNEISPEVQQLREAQVSYLNAKAALLAAQTQYQAAMTAHQQAMTEIAKNNAEADLSIKMANFAIELRNSQMVLEAAEAAHAQALVELQREIAEANNAKAIEYLGIYTDAMQEVFGLSADKIVLETEIAEAKALLASASSPWEQVKRTLERNLAKANAELAAEEAALVKLEEVAADPTSATEEAAALRIEIAELENAIAALYVEETKLSQAYSAAWDKFWDAYDVVEEYERLEEEVSNLESNIEFYTTQIASYEQSLKFENDELTTLKKILADFEAALAPYEKAYKDAVATTKAAENVLTAAEAKVKEAQNDYNNDPTAENLKALEDAQAARDKAAADLDKARTAENEAFNEYVGPRNSRDEAKNDVEDQQRVVDNVTQNLANAKETRAYWTEYKTNLEAQMAAIQADYDDAVANKTAYYGAALAASDAYNAVWDKINAAESKISNNWWLVSTLENYIDNINGAIESKMAEIEDTKSDIYSIEESIAANKIDKVKMEAEIATMEAELAQLEEAIASVQAIADQYKALMDTILSGN